MHYVKLTQNKSSFWKKYFFVLTITSVVIFTAVLFALVSGPGTVFDYVYKVSSALSRYPFKTTDDRVNILLLGNAGGRHDGAYLTDTIIVASYNIKAQKVTFISLPRDLWIDKLKAKANAVYEIGQNQNQGFKVSEKVFGDILGIPIHYSLRLDFSGFEKAIDEIGGIEVEVARSFDDNLYPIAGREDDLCGFTEEEREFSELEAKELNIDPGKRKVLISPEGKIATDSAEPEKGFEYFTCRYEQIHFDKGPTQMDGVTTLKFVRSRMGTSGEGSDFARSARQQKVLESFRKKVLSFETLVNPKKISGLFSAFGQSLETDMGVDDTIALYGVIKKMEGSQSIVLSNSGKDALLINPPLSDYGGAWVLVPKDSTYQEIKKYIEQTLKEEGISESTSSARSR